MLAERAARKEQQSEGRKRSPMEHMFVYELAPRMPKYLWHAGTVDERTFCKTRRTQRHLDLFTDAPTQEAAFHF